LIEITVLAQTEDQYMFATVYDQELSFYLFRKDRLSNPQWYERFNTKVDVGEAIGVTHQHKVLLEYVAQESYTHEFADLGATEQQLVRDDAEEQYVSYAFLCQSGTQHVNLKVDLQNDFNTRYNCYPKNSQQTLHLLDKYSTTVVTRVTQSEGTYFVQRSGRGGGNISNGNEKSHKPITYEKKYWKDKECYKCHKKGHPSTHCTKKPNGSDKNDDDISLAITSSSVQKKKKDLKSMNKAFTISLTLSGGPRSPVRAGRYEI
jgi:hypothetical protein